MSFTRSSPFQFVNETIIDVPPERVFEILSTGEGQREWFKDFVGLRWSSAPPQGAGSTREVKLKMLSVKERFLVWEPGKRLSFCIYAATIPLINQMVEDMQLEPSGNGRTRFLWTAHYRPSLMMRAIHPLARMIFGDLFHASTEGLRRFAESHK